jgi:hypothetical protein
MDAAAADHVINDGDRDEQITSVYLDRLNSNDQWDPDNGVLPDDTVGPRQRVSYYAVEQDIAQETADIDLSGLVEKYRIRITTARGQEFVSATQPALSQKGCGGHVRTAARGTLDCGNYVPKFVPRLPLFDPTLVATPSG